MVIFEVKGVAGVEAQIGYRDHLLEIAKGDIIPLKGSAVLVVNLKVPSYNLAGQPTYVPKDRLNIVPTSGLASVEQVAWAGSFEGYTLVGIGVDKLRPFRVRVAPGNPTQLIVEVDP